MRGGAITCALLLAVAVTAALPTTAAATPVSDDLDAYLAAQVTDSPLPGLAVAVIRDDDVLHLAGYGTAGDGRPMTPRTPMLVGSLSKSFTAVAVLQLAAAGDVDLDRPVQHYMPGFMLSDPDTAARITVATCSTTPAASPTPSRSPSRARTSSISTPTTRSWHDW